VIHLDTDVESVVGGLGLPHPIIQITELLIVWKLSASSKAMAPMCSLSTSVAERQWLAGLVGASLRVSWFMSAQRDA
jgi:hypothetical protein